jgi:hypothetical protein
VGVIRPGELHWEPVDGDPSSPEPNDPHGDPNAAPRVPRLEIGLIATVNTAAAGFGQTPAYVVRLIDDPWSARLARVARSPESATVRAALAFVSIAEAAPDAFRLRLLFGTTEGSDAAVRAAIDEAKRGADLASLVWIGVETPTGAGHD